MRQSPDGSTATPSSNGAPVWWLVCCYDCPPFDVVSGVERPGINGLLMPFGHAEEPGDYTPRAVEWVNAHGDGTGHADIIMMTSCPVEVSAVPIPRYGVVALNRREVAGAARAMRITPLGADGKPNGEPVRIEGNGTVMLRRTVVVQGDPA